MRVSFNWSFFYAVCVLFSIIGMLVLFASSNMLTFFLSLELNTYSALLMVYFGSDQKSSNGCMMYLLVKMLASAGLLWSMVFFSDFLFLFSLFLKLSFFPFVWWFPCLSESLSYWCFAYLNFVQKLVPFVLVFTTRLLSSEITYFIILFTYCLSLFNLLWNQSKMKVFLAWSSTGNLCLMLLCSIQNVFTCFFFFFVYNFVVTLLMGMLNYQKLYSWMDVFSSSTCFNAIMGFFFFVFSGFPPFLGFVVKTMFFIPWVYVKYRMFEWLGWLKVFFLVVLMILNSAMYMHILVKFYTGKMQVLNSYFSMFVSVGVVFFISNLFSLVI